MEQAVIIYLSPFDILRPRTNQVSDVRFTEGFAQNNCDVHLIVPFAKRDDNIKKEEVDAFYGLNTAFNIHYLPTEFKDEVSGIRKLMITAWYGQMAVRKIIKSIPKEKKVFIISRNPILLLPYITLKKSKLGRWKSVKVIPWLHDLKLKAKDRLIYRHADALLATNLSILHDLQKVVKKKLKFTYTLNPITQAQADEFIDKNQARKEVRLENISTPLITYTGKIGFNYNKELIHILEAAKELPEYTFLFTGGKPEAVKHWEQKCLTMNLSNIIFTGYLPDYTKIKNYQYGADVLVSYYTRQGHDPRYNLPNKLCEYMLTGNAIVSPNYPATEELLNESNCFFANPEDSNALAATIKEAVQNKEEAIKRGRNARKDVIEITFKKTAFRLLTFLNSI
jgi:glycosyltransferase involved in cell wall biosynthesis